MNARVMTRAALALALLAALLVVSLAGRLPGIGAEAAPTADGATDFALSGAATGTLGPGLAPAPVDLAVTNPNYLPLRVTSLAVRVTGTSRSDCTAADFTVRQYAGPYPLTVAARGQGVRLTSLGVPSAALPTLAMLDGARNQDACKGVTVHLALTGSAAYR
jgi:hypothetical protein